jgi:hypothetical protein
VPSTSSRRDRGLRRRQGPGRVRRRRRGTRRSRRSTPHRGAK